MKEKYLASSRDTVIEDVRIEHHSPNEENFPHWVQERIGGVPREVWLVHIFSRTGITAVSAASLIFFSENDAQQFQKAYPVGKVVREGLFEYPAFSGDTVKQQVDHAARNGFASPANPDSILLYDVLETAGLAGFKDAEPSQAVLDFLGLGRVEDLKAVHDGVWGHSAIFEYCLLNLPRSSPAYLAAACRFHYHVTQDDFSAGYLLRELEVIVMDVEADARRVRQMNENAGAKGKEASARNRKRRISSLMDALEYTDQHNPNVRTSLGEKALLQMAKDAAVQADPKLRSQGQNQVDQYLGEIRRGEAGKSLQARYRRLFPDKTA